MKTALRLTWIWAALVFAYLLWESKYAVGASGVLIRLQYMWLGYYKPAVSFLFLALLFAVPVTVAFLLPFRRRKQLTDGSLSAERRAVLNIAHRRLRVLLVISGVAAACAVACLVVSLTLPMPNGAPVPVQADQRLGAELPRGSVYLEHPRIAGPVVRYNQRVLWIDHFTHYVPIATGADSHRASLYVEIGGDVEHGRDFTIAPRYDGIIVQGSMPPSVGDLYAKLGVLAPGPSYVLFSRPSDLARPWIIGVLQFAISGLIVLVFVLLQVRHLRRLERGEMPVHGEPATHTSDSGASLATA